jgi:hypothetical protein
MRVAQRARLRLVNMQPLANDTVIVHDRLTARAQDRHARHRPTA